MPRTVSDPKVRQVGFFAPPDRSQSGPPVPTSSSPPVSDISPSGNSLSPVMIPPPRNLSSDMSRYFPPAPISPLRRGRGAADSSIPVGSYNPSEFISPTATADFSEDALSPGGSRKGNSAKFASSLPTGGIGMVKQNKGPASGLTMVSTVRVPEAIKEKERVSMEEVQMEQQPGDSKPLKEKTTKAERRALQESQRAAKAAAKPEGSKAQAAASGVNAVNASPGKVPKATPSKKDSSSVVASEKRGGDRQPDKDRKKDVPHPRMQFDDKNRVEKAKKAIGRETN